MAFCTISLFNPQFHIQTLENRLLVFGVLPKVAMANNIGTRRVFFLGCHIKQLRHWRINMEPKNGGLEDDVPFQLGDF